MRPRGSKVHSAHCLVYIRHWFSRKAPHLRLFLCGTKKKMFSRNECIAKGGIFFFFQIVIRFRSGLLVWSGKYSAKMVAEGKARPCSFARVIILYPFIRVDKWLNVILWFICLHFYKGGELKAVSLHKFSWRITFAAKGGFQNIWTSGNNARKFIGACTGFLMRIIWFTIFSWGVGGGAKHVWMFEWVESKLIFL